MATPAALPTAGPDADRVRIPADVDQPDRILFGLTARQLTVLTPALLAAAAVYTTAGAHLPRPVAAAVCLPLLAAGVAFALGRRGGLPADRYAAAAFAHHRSARTQVAAPAGLPATPGWLPDLPAAGPPPAPARPLARQVAPTGVADLGEGGVAVAADVEGTHFALASQAERHAQVAAFARVLNAASGPLQVCVRTAPVQLAGHLARLRENAGRLPHPALRAAAADHATHLEHLAAHRTLLARHILLIAREPAPGGGDRQAAAARARRRLDDAAALLATAGLPTRLLDGPTLTAVLAAAAHPAGPPPPHATTATGTITATPPGEQR